MTETDTPPADSEEPALYEIRLAGQLADHWANWFEGLSVTQEEGGDTLLTGPVVDQAALHGLLRKVRDLGVTLISVTRLQSNSTDTGDAQKGDLSLPDS